MLSEQTRSPHTESRPIQPFESETQTAINLLQVISNHLLDRPEKASIEVVRATSEVLVQLQIPQDELGKVIGRDGRTASALRCLLSALSHKTGTRFNLHIVEQTGQNPSIPPLQSRTKL